MRGSLRIAKLDFFIMRSQAIAYLSLIIIFVLLGVTGSSITVLGVNGAWFMALMSTSIFNIQEKNNLDRLYVSASITWKNIVCGRYIFFFLSYIISFLLAIIIYFAFAQFQSETLTFQDVMLGFSISFLLFSIIIGIQMPMFFRIGYTRARAWALLPYLIIIGLIASAFSPLLSQFFTLDFASVLHNIIKSIEDIMYKKNTLIIGGLLISCTIQFISYKISIIAYRIHR